MIDPDHDLPITQQVELLELSRSSVYYVGRPVPDADLELMKLIDKLHLEYPFAGARMLPRSCQTCAVGSFNIPATFRK